MRRDAVAGAHDFLEVGHRAYASVLVTQAILLFEPLVARGNVGQHLDFNTFEIVRIDDVGVLYGAADQLLRRIAELREEVGRDVLDGPPLGVAPFENDRRARREQLALLE